MNEAAGSSIQQEGKEEKAEEERSSIFPPSFLRRGSSESLRSSLQGSVGWMQGITLEDVQDIVKKLDIDRDGGIQIKELELGYVAMKLLSKEERLYRAFKVCDLNNDGMVSLQELEEVLRQKNLLGDTPLGEILAEVDVDGNGVIDYEEFIKAMEVGFVEDMESFQSPKAGSGR